MCNNIDDTFNLFVTEKTKINSDAKVKLIECNDNKDELKNTLNISDEKMYLSKLRDNIEKQKEENNSLPFKIVKIKKNGFLAKVAGLYAYIAFNHMPWNYSNSKAWQSVYPQLISKIFFCKIYQIEKDPLRIVINGEIPQFVKPTLIIGKKYVGIVVNKLNYGVFIDIGYHFRWQCGSLVGLLHKSNFENIESFYNTETGQSIETIFWGYNDKDQLVFGNNPEFKEWYTGAMENLIGKIVNVKVLRPNNLELYFLVNEKYYASLPVSNLIYPENNKQVYKAICNLKHEESIHCEIIGINKLKKLFLLKWYSKEEIESVYLRNLPISKVNNVIALGNNSIQNHIDDETYDKLQLIGKTVKVEVLKKEDKLGKEHNQYLVENKYHGRLTISNTLYRISVKEKKLIESNLQDGEILDCELLSIEKKLARVRWNLTDEELKRFLQ